MNPKKRAGVHESGDGSSGLEWDPGVCDLSVESRSPGSEEQLGPGPTLPLFIREEVGAPTLALLGSSRARTRTNPS